MGRIVDSVLVEQDEVLIGRASTDIEPRGHLTHALDSRQGQDSLQDITFPEHGRNLIQCLHTDPLDAHGRSPVVGHALR